MYTSSPDYLYCRNGIFYFTRNVPSDLKSRFNKNRVVVSLHTRSITRAQKSASALSDRLDRYFESLRLERFHSQELGLKFDANMVTAFDEPEVTITDAPEIGRQLTEDERLERYPNWDVGLNMETLNANY